MVYKINVGKYLSRWSSLTDLPPALQVSVNLMQETSFYFKLMFSVEKAKKMPQQSISQK